MSPNGKYLVTATTLTSTITIIDTSADTLVKVLPCSAGCHGVNFGAKKGGGYYAYVSSKFSNDLIVVDPDPNDDGNPMDAAIAGRVILVAGAERLQRVGAEAAQYVEKAAHPEADQSDSLRHVLGREAQPPGRLIAAFFVIPIIS